MAVAIVACALVSLLSNCGRKRCPPALWVAIAALCYILGRMARGERFAVVCRADYRIGGHTPNPRGLTAVALVGTPIAGVLTGMLEFIILNGTDAFLVLAIAIAPFTVGAALLMKSQNLLWSSLGRVNLLFMMVILASSNPQTYNPQVFLFTSLFSVAAAAQRPLRKVALRRSCLHLGTSGATRAGPDQDRQRASRRAAGVRLDRNGYDPGQQGRRERNALAKSLYPTRDELLRINRWSFGAVRLHSGPFVSVTVKAAIS